MRIAIIGAGVSGSLAARLLAAEHDVALFEAADYAGGHANTVDVSLGSQIFPVDTGFMVFNRRTYPQFCRLLEMLRIRSQPSDMSFSVRCSRSGLEYSGSSLNGLFAQRRNLLRPSFVRMLNDIRRFNALARSAAGQDNLGDGLTMGDFLARCGVGRRFIDQYLTPMAGAIWSTRPRAILDFPAKFMIGFFANHGLLQLRDRPQWRTIVGGSRTYVEALLRPITAHVHLRRPVESVARTVNDVRVTPVGEPSECFDEVVFALHADDALRLLEDPSEDEREILGAFPYQSNEAILHTDQSLLPRRRRAWSSWNYHIADAQTTTAAVTYDLSRLQRHPGAQPLLLTLNENHSIEPAKVLRRFGYRHPAYSQASIAAQRNYDLIGGRRRTHYCGAYWGYGFHEDGVVSALRVARSFGIELEACTAASTKEKSNIVGASL